MHINRYEVVNWYKIIKSAVLEGVKGDTPLVGENTLPIGVNEHSVLAKSLAHVEWPRGHLERHVVYEHRRFSRTIGPHCSLFSNTCPIYINQTIE